MVDLIPGRNGGSIMPAWTKGAHGTAAASNRSPIRAIRKQALGLLAEATPAASRTLVQMMESDDERVVVIAATQILDRVLGKPTEAAQAAEDGRNVDITHLSPDERTELMAAFATIYRLTGRGPGGSTIDGTENNLPG